MRARDSTKKVLSTECYHVRYFPPSFSPLLLQKAKPVNNTVADAMKFVVHFMGDVHQPLHVGFSSDRVSSENGLFVLFVCFSLFCLFVCFSLFVCLFVCLFVLFVCLFVLFCFVLFCLFVCLFVCLFCLFCLFVFVCLLTICPGVCFVLGTLKLWCISWAMCTSRCTWAFLPIEWVLKVD